MFSSFIHILTGDFISRSLLAGTLLALPLALTGCFLVWRRLVFLGDTLSHGAILGAALGIFMHLNMPLAVLLTSLFLAFLLSRLSRNSSIPIDTWMSIISYTSLALGFILLSLSPQKLVEPDALLFGDILAISREDLGWITVMSFISIVITIKNWRIWLLMTFNEDLCTTSGINTKQHQSLFIGVIAMVIAIGMKMVGALLLPALMILPIATVVPFARSPERMAGLACGCILASYYLGFWASFSFDTPTGPTIVITASVLLCGGLGMRKIQSLSTKT